MQHGHGQDAARSPYKDELAAIGRYFDQQLYRGIFVAEVDEGYIGKARPAEDLAELKAEGFTFPYDDVRALIANTSAGAPGSLSHDGPTLCPGGYGLFLGAVGAMCDRVRASYVSVMELNTGFLLGFSTATTDGRPLERRRYHLDRLGVEEMINRVVD